jgi:endonuclease YncB( thermonuclease family)
MILLCLLSCNNNRHRRHERENRENNTEISVSEKSVSAFVIKKGVECSVKVVGITDGDAFKGLIANNEQVKCRIFGIGAPEKKEEFGNIKNNKYKDLDFSVSYMF